MGERTDAHQEYGTQERKQEIIIEQKPRFEHGAQVGRRIGASRSGAKDRCEKVARKEVGSEEIGGQEVLGEEGICQEVEFVAFAFRLIEFPQPEFGLSPIFRQIERRQI